MTPLEALRLFHIVAGAAALISMWVPILAAKGSRLHTRGGLVYLGAMLAACAAALGVAALRVIGSEPGTVSQSIFLAFIAAMAAANAIDGRAAVKDKHRTTEADRSRLVPSMVVTISGVALLVWSVQTKAWLFAVFALSGVFNAWSSIRFFSNPPASKDAWLRHHLGQLGAACIATVTAFVVVNASKVMPEALGWIAWILPGVIGGVVLARASRGLTPKP